ncbi:MAG TPA: sugar ABC transporter substrate-binding protein, partial [Faecalibacterium sp.]|nr:sugar ABC transporter substrate-binding protein [Faecalibacterium sp.]
MSKAISRRDFIKVTGAVGAAGLLAACGGNSGAASSTAPASSAAAASVEAVGGLSSDPVTLTMSWWGGESRHNAYQDAIKAFSAEHSSITVNPTFAAWSGWEDTMSTKFAGGVAEDVCQINWNWLYNYSKNGQTFVDLNSTTDYLDLSQWDEAQLAACNVANAQQCVPVSMTGRIFFWNMTTFNKAGITEVPKSLDDLMAAGKAFQEKLGDDYYPLHLGAYDRMILMVFYLESKYGKDWADPTTS